MGSRCAKHLAAGSSNSPWFGYDFCEKRFRLKRGLNIRISATRKAAHHNTGKELWRGFARAASEPVAVAVAKFIRGEPPCPPELCSGEE